MLVYYQENGAQLGPFTRHEVFARVKSGQIKPETLVWYQGLQDWVPFGQVSAQILEEVQKSVTAPPLPSSPVPQSTREQYAQASQGPRKKSGVGKIVAAVIAVLVVGFIVRVLFFGEEKEVVIEWEPEAVTQMLNEVDEDWTNAENAYRNGSFTSAAFGYEQGYQAIKPYLDKFPQNQLPSGETLQQWYEQRQIPFYAAQDEGFEILAQKLSVGDLPVQHVKQHLAKMKSLGNVHAQELYDAALPQISKDREANAAHWVRVIVTGDQDYAKLVTSALKEKWDFDNSGEYRLMFENALTDAEASATWRSITIRPTEVSDEYYDEVSNKLLIRLPFRVHTSITMNKTVTNRESSWDSIEIPNVEISLPDTIQVSQIGTQTRVVGQDANDYHQLLVNRYNLEVRKNIPEFKVGPLGTLPRASTASINTSRSSQGSSHAHTGQSTAPMELSTASANGVPLPLSGKLEAVSIVKGGSQLAFATSGPSTMEFFDVEQKKLTGKTTLPVEDFLMTSNRDIFYFYDKPKSQLIAMSQENMEVVRLQSFRDTPLIAIATAWGSTDAPLVTTTTDGPLFLRSTTLTPLKFTFEDGLERTLKIDLRNKVSMRFAGDGETMAYWRNDISPMGISVLDFSSSKLKQYYEHKTAGHLSPSYDSEYLFTGRNGYYQLPDLKPVREITLGKRPANLIAAVKGDYFVAVDYSNKEPLVALYRTGDSEPFQSFVADEMIFEGHPYHLFSEDKNKITIDRRFFFFPSDGLLVTIPFSDDRIIYREIAMPGS